MSRQVSRWTRQYEASKTDEIESMESLIQWLNEKGRRDHHDRPWGLSPGEHGVIHPTEPRGGCCCLDWELCTLGHPLADLAYNCMPYPRFPAESGTNLGLGGLDLEALGIPSESGYVDAYCRRMGHGPKRYRTGTSSSPSASSASPPSCKAFIKEGAAKLNAHVCRAEYLGICVTFLSDTGWQIASSG